MNSILKHFKIINSKRQPPNLKHILTKAKFTEKLELDKTISKCNRPNCGLCTYLLEGCEYTFKCGLTFKVKTDISCNVKNIIYAIVCQGCGKEYIGETSHMRNRITVHKQQIKVPSTRILKVSKHLDDCSSTEPKFLVFPFYKLTTDNAIMRKRKENLFIKKLKPELNCH